MGCAGDAVPSRVSTKAEGTVLVPHHATVLPGARTDWPGWRNDGSGVSLDVGVPQSWDITKNVRWVTAIPGVGRSSPIVSNGLVFVTTAVEDRLELVKWSDQWGVDPIFRLLLLGLTLAALLWSVDTIFRCPLTPHCWFEPREMSSSASRPTMTVAARSLRVGLFLTVLYSLLVLYAWMRGSLPALSEGRNAQPSWAITLFSDSLPTRLTVWALGGVLAGLSVWASGRRRQSAPTTSGPMTVEGLTGAFDGVLVFAALGAFFGLALLPQTLTPPPHPHGWITVFWTETSVICATGMMVLVGVLSRGTRWGWVSGAIAMSLLALLVFGPPNDPAGWHRFSSSKKFLALFTCAAVGIGWFSLGDVWRRATHGLQTSFARRPGFGPVALTLLIMAFFGWMAAKALIPERVFHRGIVAVDRETGRLLWHVPCVTAGLTTGTLHAKNSPATPTPVSDGQYVYANFGDAGTCALDFSGRVVWMNTDRPASMHWGPASSPILWQGLIILTNDTDTRQSTVALDKSTGEVRWTAERTPTDSTSGSSTRLAGMDGYSTPIIVNAGGREQLVHYSSLYVAAYEPSTGDEIWSVSPRDEGFHDMLFATQIVPSPVAAMDMIVFGGSCTAPGHISALRVGAKPGANEPALAWQDTKSVPGCSSPVVYGEHVYAVTNNGIVSGRNLRTGELVSRLRLSPGFYSAAIVAADGKLFFTSEEGETTVVEADPGLHRLSVNTLGEGTNGSLAISRGEIFIRGTEHLFSISSR
jgi:outer membrane protein assembly factor BamB